MAMAMAMARSNREDSLVFSSLMPHLFPRLPSPLDDTTLTEHELQEINRLLALEKLRETNSSADRRKRSRCDDSGPRQASTLPLTVSDKSNGTVEAAFPTKRSLAQAVYCDGKENIPSSGILRRNRFSRRERSSRITSRRKPFVVDLGKFNMETLEECRKLQDVHAFWEAAEERDASEAMLKKLKGESESSSEMSRMRPVRHGNSQRTTSRVRGFSVELPSFADQMTLDERSEGEPDLTEDSCFTLLSNPQISCEQKESQMSQIVHCVQSESVTEKPCTHTETNLIIDALSSPRLKSNQDTQNDMEHYDSGNEIPDFRNSSPSGSPDQQANDETSDKDEMGITPFMRKRATKTTPFTSPTPPPNPLAGIYLRDDNNSDNVLAEDSGKRRLDFMETMDIPDLEPELVDHTSKEDARNTDDPSQKQNSEDLTPVVEGTISKRSLQTPVLKQKQSQTTRRGRKRPLDNRRSSLAAAGTRWDVGVRRSTRIRSRPLEWWKGERFLLGRVHKSLVTVIGIKYTSASPCDSKKGARFKVESYVPEEYEKYVKFAAL